ncbi:MAG: hypothetical protein KBD24_01645 [Candidatus Pacebacteria bacterium]|nr:hypothetical protein [Candidatus Paceibacterota bacterium]
MRYGKLLVLPVLVGIISLLYWYLPQGSDVLVLSGFLDGLLTALTILIGIPTVIGVLVLLVWGVRKYKVWRASRVVPTTPGVAVPVTSPTPPVVSTTGVWITARTWVVVEAVVIGVILLAVLVWQFGGGTLKSATDMTALSVAGTTGIGGFWIFPILLALPFVMALFWLLRSTKTVATATATSTSKKVDSNDWVWLVLGIVAIVVAGFIVLVSMGVINSVDKTASMDLRSVTPYLLVPLTAWYAHNFSGDDNGNIRNTTRVAWLTLVAVFLWQQQDMVAEIIRALGLGIGASVPLIPHEHWVWTPLTLVGIGLATFLVWDGLWNGKVFRLVAVINIVLFVRMLLQA